MTLTPHRHAVWIRILFALLALALTALSQSANANSYKPGEKPFQFETTPGALSKFVVPKRSSVELTLDPYGDSFSGRVTHVVDVRKPTREIKLNASRLAISRAVHLGATQEAALDFSLDEKTQLLTLRLPQEIAQGEHKVAIEFSGKLTANGYGLYFARYKDAAGVDRRMLATQMEPTGAREMVPCFDEPSFRTVWDVVIVADAKYTALSNMPVKSQRHEGAKLRTEFAPTPSMSSYLLAVALGELERTSDQFEGIELNIYTVATKHQHTRYAMESTKKVLAYFKDYFGSPYQLPKLDQIAVPGKRGAMENWGLVTYSESLLMVDPASASYDQRFWSFNVIAHELAHQWFGNLVTMAWWDGLWLNESFAEWMAHKATAALNPEWNLAPRKAEAKRRAMEVDALANANPIERAVDRDQNSGDLFDSLTYQKGHAVLNMIEGYAGETAWRDGLRDYMQKHAYSNATSADLWAAITHKTQQSGRDVKLFASAWTQQPGFPLLDATSRCVNGKQVLTLTQSRFALKAGYVPQQTWGLAVLLSRPKQSQSSPRTVFVGSQPQRFVGGACGEPWVIDVGGDGYYRVRYDASLSRALLSDVRAIATSDRMRLASDAWALAEAGLAPPERAFAFIAALRADDPPELWNDAIEIYTRARQLLRMGPLRDALDAHARRTLKKPFAALGWTPKPGESEATRSLRGELIAALAIAGDNAVIGEARSRFPAIEHGELIDGDVRSGALRAVGAAAGTQDIDRLAAMLTSGKFPVLERTLVSAMGAARDRNVAAHVLTYSLSDALPRAASQRIVSVVAGSGLLDSLAFEFTQANLDKLFAKTSTYGRRYVVAAPLNGSRDAQLAAALSALADKHLEPDARLETLRALASVERNQWAYGAIRARLAFLMKP